MSRTVKDIWFFNYSISFFTLTIYCNVIFLCLLKFGELIICQSWMVVFPMSRETIISKFNWIKYHYEVHAYFMPTSVISQMTCSLSWHRISLFGSKRATERSRTYGRLRWWKERIKLMECRKRKTMKCFKRTQMKLLSRDDFARWKKKKKLKEVNRDSWETIIVCPSISFQFVIRLWTADFHE